MNLAVADLFTLNIYGLQGSLVTSLAHGLSSSGLFCSVGFIQDRTDNRNLFTLAFINSFNMYPVFSTSLFLLILGTTSFPGTLNFIGELFNMISLSIVDVVFNGLFVTSIPLTTSYSLFLFKRSCGNIYLNYRNQTMDVSRLYLWIPSAALFPLTATTCILIMAKPPVRARVNAAILPGISTMNPGWFTDGRQFMTGNSKSNNEKGY